MGFNAVNWKDATTHEYPGHERGMTPSGSAQQAKVQRGTLTGPSEELRHLIVRKAHGGHVVEHHHHGGQMHEHVFSSGDDMLAHVANHMGVAGNDEVGGGQEEGQKEKYSDG